MDKQSIIRILASAGGGKTYALSQRYISLLKSNPDLLPHILGITFTNKAANEMKERILSLLKEEALKGSRESGLIVERILDNFSDFSIKTIDSFMNSILKSFALELHIPPDAEIVVDEEYYKKLAYEKLIRRIEERKDIRELFMNMIDFLTGHEISSSWKPWEYPEEHLRYLLNQINSRGIDVVEPEYNEPPQEIIKNLSEDEFTRFKEYKFATYLARLFHHYQDELKNVKEELGIILISELAREIYRVVYSETSIPFIYYKLGEKFLHYLIDEFQDTNILQWINILPLIENALSQGGSLFYVGDPKQAIYQWRGGEVELFDMAYEGFEFVGDNRVSKNLNKNYRSKKTILDFVLNIFSLDKIKSIVGEEHSEILESFYDVEKILQVPGKEELETGGYVRVDVFPDTKQRKADTFIKDAVVSRVKDILKRWKRRDVAILVRDNREGTTIVEWLNSEGIPVLSAESLHIGKNQIVREIISFLRFLNSPVDDTSFLLFITGRIFTTIVMERETILEWAMNRRNGIPLYIQFREDFTKLWEEYINPVFILEGYVPAYEIVSELISLYGLYSKEEFSEDIAFIETLLDTIHKLEKTEGNSITAILDWWDRTAEEKTPSITLPENIDAVQVLTVHKAKGLEFPVVFIPYTVHTSPGRMDKLISVDTEKGKGFIRNTSKTRKMDSNAEEAFRQYLSKAIFSEINLFYVATTRAREELHIFYHTGDISRSPKYILNKLWSYILLASLGGEDFESGTPLRGGKGEELPFIKPIRTHGGEELKAKILLRKQKWEKTYPEPEVTGILFHRIMELSDKFQRDEIMMNLEFVLRESLPEKIRVIYRKKLIELIDRFLDIEGFKELLSDKNEREIWGHDGEGLLRIDRIDIFEDHINIIDYKTGEENYEAEEQMERYKTFIRSMYPDIEVKGYIVNVPLKRIQEV